MSDSTKLEIILAAKDATAKAFGTVRSSLRGVENAIFSVKGALTGLGVGLAAKELFDAGIESQKLDVSFRAITGSAAAASREFGFLRGISKEMSTEFYSTADAYKDILAASKGTALEGAASRDIFLGIAEAGRVLSMTNDELSGSMKSIRDMMSKGTIMAEELKGQLGDRLPGAVNLAAEAMGKTTEELLKMMENGELLAEDLLPKLASVLHNKYGLAARDANETALAAMNRLTTGWKDFKVEIAESGFLDIAVDALDGVTAQLDEWGNWISTHESDVKRFFSEVGEGAKIMGESVSWALSGISDSFKQFAYSGRGMGLASSGAIPWSDYIFAGPEELKRIVDDFDIDPIILKLNSQKKEIESVISKLKLDLKTFLADDPLKNQVSESIAAKNKELESLNKQIADLRKGVESVPTITAPVVSDDAAKGTEKNVKKITGAMKKAMAELDNLGPWTDSDKVLAFDPFPGFDEEGYYSALDVSQMISDLRVETMDRGSEEYISLAADIEMRRWEKVKGITEEQLEEVRDIIVKGLAPGSGDDVWTPEDADNWKKYIKNYVRESFSFGPTTYDTDSEETKQEKLELRSAFVGVSMAVSMGDAFSDTMDDVFFDALKFKFDDFGSYFKGFIDDLSGMWSGLASDMMMSQLTGSGFSAGAWAGLGAAGVGLAAVNNFIDGRERRKAEKARKAALRAQLEDELNESIAGLTLSDTGKAIFDLNERIKDLTASAMDAGYPMEKIIELRKLETQSILDDVAARYRDVTSNAADWVEGIQRESWSISDWNAEQSRLYDALYALDENSKDYQDESVDILNDIFGVIKSTYEIQKSQLASMQSASVSLESQIWNLSHSDGMAVSAQDYMDRYEELLSAATTQDENGFLSASAITDFQNFIGEYSDVLSGLGYDFTGLIGNITGDLGNIYDDVNLEMTQLTDAIELNTDALSKDGGVIDAITDLTTVTQNIADREIYNAYMETLPAQSGIMSGYYGNKLNYNAWGGGTFSFDINPDAYKVNAGNADGWYDFASGWFELYSEYLPWLQELPQATLSDDQKEKISDWITWLEGIPISEAPASAEEFYRQLLLSGVEGLADWNDWYDDKPSTFLQFARGGYSDRAAIFGEAGPEWAVPASGNPNNENFLKSVGIDRVVSAMAIDYDKMAQAIARYLAPLFAQFGSMVFEGKIDEQVLIKWFHRQLDSNGDLVRSVQIAAGVN